MASEVRSAGLTPGATRSDLTLPGIRLSVLHWLPTGPHAAAGGAVRGEIVLLHGLHGSAATQVRFATALTDEGWSVRALDLPGHGHSAWLDDEGLPLHDQETVQPSVYRLDRLGDVVARALGLLELPSPPVVIGHSWGAGVAAASILERAPLGRAILIDPPFMSAPATAELVSELEARLRPDLDAARAVLLAENPDWDPDDLETTAEALTQASPLALGAAAVENGDGPYRFLQRWRAERPRARVDIICGSPKNGGLVPWRARQILRILLGRGHVHYLRQAGHSPQFTHMNDVMRLMRRLLG
ncbi:MAG: alpha/beta fold hydrolase [Chloroflexi bacterium]|nr:alpha/beta fold hydrolase [Chloroflexota bacterium]